MEYKTIKVSKQDAVAVIALNRAEKMNALSAEMIAELTHVFDEMRYDDEVGAVVLTANGTAFSAGGDINDIKKGTLFSDSFMKARRTSKEFAMKIKAFEKPVIGAINGIAAGAGAGLVLLCDTVFVSEKASFSVIFRKIGMIPDCGVLYLLPRIVGSQKAKELSFTGEIINADEMLRIGIASRVLPPDNLLDEAIKFAQLCAKGPRLALGLSKILIDRCMTMTIEEFFDYESLSIPYVIMSDDFKEGIAAFLEKRKAKFGASSL